MEGAGDIEFTEMDFTGMMSPLYTHGAATGSTPARQLGKEERAGRTDSGMGSGEKSADSDHHDTDVGARLNGMLSVVTGSHRSDSDVDLNNPSPDSPKKRFSVLLKNMSSGARDTVKTEMLAGQTSSSFSDKGGGNGSGSLSSIAMFSNRARWTRSKEDQHDFRIRQGTGAARTQSTAPPERSRFRFEDKGNEILPIDGSGWSAATLFQKLQIMLRDGELETRFFHHPPHPFKPQHRPTTFSQIKQHPRYGMP